MGDNVSQEIEKYMEDVKKLHERNKYAKIFAACVFFCYIIILFSAQLLFDEIFYTKIYTLFKDKYGIIALLFFSVIILTISALRLSNLISKTKSEKSILELKAGVIKGNIYEFTPSKDQEYFVICIRYILGKIADYKEINECRRKELSDIGRSYLMRGVIFYSACIIIFQFFIHISPEKELFKIYGMVSCAVVFMIIVCVGIWHLNQAKNYSKNLSKIMNAELAIVKCLLICNLDLDKEEKSDLLRAELVNAEIKNDAKDSAAADIPYKMAFDVFKDMMKKNQ